jgi:hypothetical protein
LTTSDRQPPLDPQAHALALLVQHPDWTNTQIAKAVGVNRTTLYDWPRFKAARAAYKRANKDRLPRGCKSQDRDVEAWDDDT